MSVFDEIAVELVASDLAVDVLYTPQSGVATSLRGILVRTSDDERRATSVYARLFVSLADLAATPASGDQVVVDSQTYKVFEVALESGGAWLWLRKDV